MRYYSRKCFKLRLIILSFFLFESTLYSQEIIWANKLLEFTDRYQFENNFSEFVLGPPTIYPAISLEQSFDVYSEGYIVNYVKSRKRNVIRVGFPKPTIANQILIGGVLNVGSIDEIYITLKNGKDKLVYKEKKGTSKSKFKSFATFISLNTVYGLKLVVDHSKINKWNIIKGIGLANSEALKAISPDLIEDTTHHHTRQIIGENINSKDCYEFSPKISPNGKTLYFVKECKDQPDQDIWYTELDSAGKWKEAKNMGIPLNNNGHNFVASISPDGNTLVIGNKYKADGSDGGDGVSISTKNEEGKWSLPQAIDIPDLTNLNEHANFYMSPNGDAMLIAMQGKDSYGDLDLYASLFNKVSKKWSAPINLGPEINTPYAEDYPYIANDNATLYYSSKGFIGYGGHDIMMSKRFDDTWLNWQKPKNLGPFVNTKSDDKGFVIANQGDHAYFNSVPFNSDLHHMDIFTVDLPKMLNQNPRVLVSGKLFDNKTNQPLRGSITIKDKDDYVVAVCSSNPNTGEYIVALPFGETYSVQIDALEHYKINDKLVLTDTAIGIELGKSYQFMAFMDSGFVYKIENILFDFNRSSLREDSYQELNKIAGWMKEQANSKFEISGHTDDKGSDILNLWISGRRASAVQNYLVSMGVKATRLTAKGYGESKPISTNDTEEGRSLNRRVEIVTLTKNKKKKENKGLANKRFKLSTVVNAEQAEDNPNKKKRKRN